MATIVDLHEAKIHLSKLLQRVMNGEQIIIAQAGNPIAILAPNSDSTKDRVPGIDVGKVVISPDFDDPLPEFDL